MAKYIDKMANEAFIHETNFSLDTEKDYKLGFVRGVQAVIRELGKIGGDHTEYRYGISSLIRMLND